MMPKKRRVSRRGFEKVLSMGRTYHSSHFSIRIYEADKGKFATVVSKKVALRAVDRNKLRRRVYAALQSLILDPTASPTIVVFAKKGASALRFKDIVAEIWLIIEKNSAITLRKGGK